MAIWLFRRKSRRKQRARNGDDAQPQSQRPVNRSNTAPDEPIIATPPRRNSSIQKNKNKQRTEPTKLQRRARTYSFDAGRRESLNVRKQAHQDAPPVPPLPGAHSTRAPGTHHGGNITNNEAYQAGGYGQDAVGDIQRIPTLHATKSKRGGQHLGPRKSSKRRKNSHDREREAELKAMSNFVPHRPATDQWTAGRSMRKDTRRVKTGLGIGFGGPKEERSSTISLPTPESIHSNMSTDSEHVAFKVSAFSALAARPTLRYSLEPRWTPPSSSSAPLRRPSQRKRLSEKEPIAEATLKAHKRIDDLADDLNASDLRELMERDQRRRDKRRQSEQEKVERRLQRRAEKERQAVASGSSPAHNMERGVLGRESVGLGIEPPSAVVTSSRSRESLPGKQKSPVAAESTQVEDERESRGPSPIRSFHRTSSIPPDSREEPVATPEPEPEKLATVPSQNQSPTRRGFLRVKKTRSVSANAQGQSEGAPESSRKGSEGSSSRGPLSWTSFFRWGNKSRRESGPSSFSNTSRDSMATMPQPAAPINFVPSRRMSSGVPRRTLSRFREDLPDFPLSPPESRLQSPESDPMPPAIIEQDSPPIEATADPMAVAAEQYSTPTSQQHSSDADHMRETPISDTARDEAVVSTEPQQSVSMASIDSEASWLSGRIGSRRSSAIQQRQSATNSRQSHYQQRTPTGSDEAGDGDIAEEEMTGITDDEYLNRYARRPSAATWTNRKSVGDPQASSDEELERGDDARWGSVGGGRMPTVVSGHSVKSREGLLNMFDHDDEADPDSPISPISIGSKDAEAGLQRATSVNLGKQHARHISAGSAKLLEISPRNSVDQKRRMDI